MRLPLLDARIALIKTLGVGSRASKGFKYSDVKVAVDEAVSEAVGHLEEARPVLRDESLFSKGCAIAPDRMKSCIPQPVLANPSLAWNSSHALQLFRKRKQSKARQCLHNRTLNKNVHPAK